MNTISSLPDSSITAGLDPSLPEKMGKLQLQFAAHIRDPIEQAIPVDIEDRRMAIYRDLFYNNIEGFLSGNFPVIRKLFDDKSWHQLVRKFFRDYRCHTPLFPEIPREFIRFLEQHNPYEDKPFLLELAHYEWVEVALELDTSSIDMTKVDPEGDLLLGKPILSPQAWLLRYEWPVYKISPDFQPTETPDQASFILVRRNPEDRIDFIHLNQVSARLLELLGLEDTLNGHSCLLQIANELGRPDDPLILATGKNLLLDFKQKNIILGTTISHPRKTYELT